MRFTLHPLATCMAACLMTPAASGAFAGLPVDEGVAVAPATVTPFAHSDNGVIEIMVNTGSREATRLEDTPAAISVLNAQQIEDTRPTRIDQVLNTLPGVHMADLANEQHAMSIRQPITTGAYYQYLEDGVPIRPLGIFNHNTLNELNLVSTEQVEVLRGPASSLYGSNAIGGAVNFMTKAPSESPEWHVGLRGSDRGYRRADFGASTTQGGTGVRIEGYHAENTTPWRTYNGFTKDALSLRVDRSVGAATQLRSTFTYSNLDSEMPGSLGERDFNLNPRFSNQTFTYRRDRALRLSTALETRWDERTVSTVTFYGRQNDHGQNPSYSVAPCANTSGLCTGSGATTFQATGVVNNNAYTSLGVDARWRRDYAPMRTRWINGFSLDRSPNHYTQDDLRIVRDPATGSSFRYVGYSIPDYTTYTAGMRTLSRRRDYTVEILNPSAYSQLEMSPVERLRVVAGARYDIIRYRHQNALASQGFGAPDDSQSFSHASPKIGAVYVASEQVQLYGNLSTGFAPPEVSALYGALSVPNLKPSTFRNVDAGVRYQARDGRTRVEATLYRLDGRNEVVNYTDAANNRYPVNSGQTRHEGLELALHRHFSARWEGRLAATIARHYYDSYSPKAGIRYDGNSMPTAPRALANAELAWLPTLHTRLALEAQHVGPYWMDDANKVAYGGHALVNLRGQYQQGAWTFFLHGLNLGDVNYSTLSSVSFNAVSHTPGEPRTVLAGVDYRFR